MSDSPWFSFYASDFLAGTACMEPDAVGVYVRLLCIQWDKGEIPTDDRALARACGCFPEELDKYRGLIRAKFPDGRNPRLEREAEKRESQRKNGIKGGRPKSQQETQSKANRKPTGNPMETQSKAKPKAPQPQVQPEYYPSDNTERENARALAEGEIPRQLETLKAHLGTVRRGWSVEFGADERESLIRQGYLAALLSLSDDDWQAMGEMLGSSQKAGDRREALKIGMPNRRTLITNTADWLSNLERYQSRHKRATVAARAPTVPDYEPTDEEREQMRRMIAESLK